MIEHFRARIYIPRKTTLAEARRLNREAKVWEAEFKAKCHTMVGCRVFNNDPPPTCPVCRQEEAPR